MSIIRRVVVLFRRHWRALVLTDLLGKAVTVTLLAPVVSVSLKLFLMTTPEGVVTDQAIAGFLLHPVGFTALVVAAGLSTAILCVELGALMAVVLCREGGPALGWLGGILYALALWRPLLGGAARVVFRLLWIAAPSVAVVGGLYLVFLQEYDINYYLSARPAVFGWVVAGSGVAVLVMLLRMVWQAAGWTLALPLVLFEGVDGEGGLSRSEDRCGEHRFRLVVWLGCWAVGVVVMGVVVTWVAGVLGGLLVPRGEAGLLGIWFGVLGLLGVIWVSEQGVVLLATVLSALWVAEVYRELGGQGDWHMESLRFAQRAESWMRGRWVVAGVMAAVMLSAGGGYGLLRMWDEEDEAVVIAHRGGAAVAPENTMAAFERGIADGAGWLELDVQEDATGRIVVVHDRDFMRVAGRALEVAEAGGSELASLDVGSFFDAQYSSERVPTLAQVLEMARGRAGVFIELKYYGRERRLEERVIEVIEAAGMAKEVVVMSMKQEGIRKMANLRPAWTCGLLNAVAFGDITRVKFDFVAVTAEVATRAMVDRAHSRGVRVYVWTVNDPVQMSLMLSRGVDGLITDEVEMAGHVMDVREQLSGLGRFVIWLVAEAGLLRGADVSSPPDQS